MLHEQQMGAHWHPSRKKGISLVSMFSYSIERKSRR